MFMNTIEIIYEHSIKDMAEKLVGMAYFHHKSFEEVGQDLNKAVAEILKEEDDTEVVDVMARR